MRASRNAQWLLDELPGLVAEGVVPPDVAERLRLRYADGAADRGGSRGRRWTIVLFSILGAALIGSGIILLLAHNWRELSRPLRTALALAPMLAAQAAGGYALLARRRSAAWREGAGLFWALSIGASTGLVGQTYHVPSDIERFVLTWALAGLPVIYLLDCAVAVLLYWTAVTAWAAMASAGAVLWFWPLCALAVPPLAAAARANRYSARTGLLAAALAVAAAVGVGFSLARAGGGNWLFVYCGYFAFLYLLGTFVFPEGAAFWQRPLQTLGALGVIVLALILTFADPWRHFWSWTEWSEAARAGPAARAHVALSALWPAAAAVAWLCAWRRVRGVRLLFGALPLVGLAGAWLAAGRADVTVVLLMNAYVLALSVALIVLGARDRRLGVINAGMLIAAALIIARFFDSDMSFVARGVAFVAVGAGFLAANVILARRMRGAR